MKKNFFGIYIAGIVAVLAMMAGCYKDKGNYTYNMPETPEVTTLDTVYNVLVGDSLIIDAGVTMKSEADLSFEWRISTPDPDVEDLVDSSRVMRVIFGLGAERFNGKFTIINNTNGMKYFHRFVVSGKTEFSTGTTVMTLENGKTQVSFIRPDGAIQARLYSAVNPTVSLPESPTQLLGLPEWQGPGTVQSYWVFGKKGENTGVEIDANTFEAKRTLREMFFDMPDTALPQKMFTVPLGILTGIVNGRLQWGTTQTWNQAPTYGMFNLGAPGDYDLSSEIVFNYTGVHGPGNYIAFDKTTKQFLRFNLYGGPVFFGPAYAVQGSAFDPTNLGMDLTRMLQINAGMCYAYGMQDGVLVELKFDTEFNGPFNFTPIHKRNFSRPELVTSSTIWQATTNEIIYFTSGEKIYRYNPSNESFRELETSFPGKIITMMKVLNNSTMVVGVEGSMHYLNIATGNFGNEIKKVVGLPGAVMDMVERN